MFRIENNWLYLHMLTILIETQSQSYYDTYPIYKVRILDNHKNIERLMCYCKNVKTGKETFEMYSGPNYIADARRENSSYSRCWKAHEIPLVYYKVFNWLKEKHEAFNWQSFNVKNAIEEKLQELWDIS